MENRQLSPKDSAGLKMGSMTSSCCYITPSQLSIWLVFHLYKCIFKQIGICQFSMRRIWIANRACPEVEVGIMKVRFHLTAKIPQWKGVSHKIGFPGNDTRKLRNLRVSLPGDFPIPCNDSQKLKSSGYRYPVNTVLQHFFISVDFRVLLTRDCKLVIFSEIGKSLGNNTQILNVFWVLLPGDFSTSK